MMPDDDAGMPAAPSPRRAKRRAGPPEDGAAAARRHADQYAVARMSVIRCARSSVPPACRRLRLTSSTLQARDWAHDVRRTDDRRGGRAHRPDAAHAALLRARWADARCRPGRFRASSLLGTRPRLDRADHQAARDRHADPQGPPLRRAGPRGDAGSSVAVSPTASGGYATVAYRG